MIVYVQIIVKFFVIFVLYSVVRENLKFFERHELLISDPEESFIIIQNNSAIL